MGKVLIWIGGIIIGISIAYLDDPYGRGRHCDSIANRLELLEDTGTGEYAELSNKFFDDGCFIPLQKK